MKQFAHRLNKLIPSASMAMAQRIDEGNFEREIIDLTFGQPDFDTPEHIKDAAWEAIKTGHNGYTTSSGIPELRTAIVDSHKLRYNVSYAPQTEVLVTPGAKQGLMYLMQALVDPGDEVILFEPCWLSYRDMILLCGGVPRFISSQEGLIPGLSELEGCINSKTKAILINNPVNPSGYVFKRNELELIAKFAEQNDLYVIADEIYDRIAFTEFVSLSEFSSISDRLIIANGFSKTYAMTGWRIGYLLACERIISKVSLIHQHTATCASAPSQYAAVAALKGGQESVDYMVKAYKERRDLMVEGLSECPFVIVPPDGTFYAMLNISSLGSDAGSAAEKLLNEFSIAAVNGSSYGRSAGSYVRLSLTKDSKFLSEVIRRLKSI